MREIRLERLLKSVDSMDKEELMECVREIRGDRAKSKRVQRTSTKSIRQKKFEQISLNLESMDAEERNRLLEKLKNAV